MISCAVTALILGIIYRSWLLSKADEITDDAEDIRVAEQDAFDKEEDAAAEFDASEFDADEATRKKEFNEAEEKKKISQTTAQPTVSKKGD